MSLSNCNPPPLKKNLSKTLTFSPHTSLDKMGSKMLQNPPNCPKFLIFIKPFDDRVFQNFLILLDFFKKC